LLAVKIHGLKDQSGYASREGPNPLDCMGVYRTELGELLLAETNSQGVWIRYADYTQSITLPAGWEQPAGGRPIPLSRYGRLYDYVAGLGSGNFSSWVSIAAMEATR
jgi:hypothetical protein